MRRTVKVMMRSLGVVMILCLAIQGWKYGEPRLIERYPQWFWQHGSLDMQMGAGAILVTKIKPGMTYEEVLELIGPGSDDWPELKTRKLDKADTVSFNMRAPVNIGIDVGFLDGRVTWVTKYD